MKPDFDSAGSRLLIEHLKSLAIRGHLAPIISVANSINMCAGRLDQIRRGASEPTPDEANALEGATGISAAHWGRKLP